MDDHVIVLARQLGDAWAITAANNSAEEKTVTVHLPFAARSLDDALGGAAVPVHDGTLQLTVPPMFGRVLVRP